MATTILLVDDSATIRVRVSRILQQGGYQVITASSGEEAIKKMDHHPVDIAILDIVMPGIDGYQVCELLKAQGSPFGNLPIVFLTSVKSKALDIMGAQFGAYVNKPVKPAVLLTKVREALENRFVKTSY